MIIKSDRSTFLKAWQIAEKYTASQQREALNGVRITASDNTVTLEATDLKSSVKCTVKGAKVEETGVAVLNAAFFGNMLRKTTADSITLEVKDARGTLTADKSRSRFPVIPAETFPNIPESSGAEPVFSIMASDFGRVITEGSCAAGAPSDFPKYMGACLLKTAEKYIIVVSTDGRRLARSQTICTSIDKEEELVLPAAALRETAKNFTGDGTVKVLADGSTVWFMLEKKEIVREEPASSPEADNDSQAPEGSETPAEAGNDSQAPESSETTAEADNDSQAENANDSEPVTENWITKVEVMEFSMQRIETSFPKYERILNNEVRTTMKVLKPVLLPALDRIDLIAKENSGHIMAMYLNPDPTPEEPPLRITARAPELGTASEKPNAKVEGAKMQIGFNTGFFLDGLKAADSTSITVEFSSEEGQTRILKDDSADFLYMLMPVRLTPQDFVPDDESGDFSVSAYTDDFSQDDDEDSQDDEIQQDDFSQDDEIQQDEAPQYDDSDAPF